MELATHATPLIDLTTLEYPIYFRDLNDRLENKISLVPEIDNDVLKTLGYSMVVNGEIPEGDVITEDKPKLINGVWTRVFISREFTEEERISNLEMAKANLLAEVEVFRNNEFAKGFPYKFGENIYHVQVRDGDRANLLSKRTRAVEAIAAENDSYRVGYHVYENITVELTAEEMINMANTADDKVSAGYQKTWDLKEQIKEANSLKEFPEFPPSLFTIMQ